MITGTQVTILLVDDTPFNIIALEDLLEKPDRIFLKAYNGKDALKIALSHEVDLILLDVQMADMNGFEVAQILKSNNKTKNIPIIFVSAEKKEHASVLKGFEEGAVDYLSKPLDPEITKAKVSILLRVQLQKKELIEKNLSLEKSAMLIDNSADILGILDIETMKFEEVNNAISATLGYTPREAKSVQITSFMDQEGKEVLEHNLKQTAERLGFEIRMFSSKGEIKWLQWNVKAKDRKWFINARDITHQKSSDERIRQLNADLKENIMQLEATNKELESFSYSVSHDLRAPLRSLDGYSKILAEEYDAKMDEEAKRLLNIIRKNAQKMSSLIDDLLRFSKLGKKEIQKNLINMEGLVVEVIEDIPLSPAQRASIQINSLPSAYADRPLLFQVWFNLISNAVKYSGNKENFKIEIGSYPADGETVFFVKDNGAGFDMEYAHKLFQVFQRLHSQREFEGSGIGLAIVERIITKHLGKVWAEGQLNEGATFYFSLPF